MAPKPKKPGMGGPIPPAKPKPDELGAPDSLDAAPEPDVTEEVPETEVGSGDLLGDMTRPLIEAGLSDADAKIMLAGVLKAAVACLERGGQETEAPAAKEFNEYGR